MPDFLMKIRNVILKDVENENETKKTAVSLRLNSLVMEVYFLCLFGVFCAEKQYGMAIGCIVCFLVYGLGFVMTYINRTKVALWFTELLTIGWIIAFVYELGWGCGVQHFLFVLLLLVFTPSFITTQTKLMHCTALFLLRIGLFMYTRNYETSMKISSDVNVVFQILNTFFIFLAIVIALLLVTYDSARMEEKLMKYNKKLHKLASEDPLTGLPNRRSLLSSLQEHLAEQPDEIGPCVAIGDLDHFKRINDTYGHEAGDEVLKAVAGFFISFMNGKGSVGRWGGEEFLFVFHNCNLDEAKVYLSDMLHEVRKIEVPYNDQVIQFTMTIGAEEWGGEDIEKTINAADAKLYMGKESGRDKVVC